MLPGWEGHPGPARGTGRTMGQPWGTGTALRTLTPLSLLQRDELGGPELADSPLPAEPPAPRHKGSPDSASPTAAPAHGNASTDSPCTKEGGEDRGVAPAQSERAWGTAHSSFRVLWFWGTLAAPQTLCAAALEPPPIPRSWWLVRWHHGCPNPRPAPCGGFIAGMNTVICRGRAAQLQGWGVHFGDLGWGGRSSRQHPSCCPPPSLLTAGTLVSPAAKGTRCPRWRGEHT